MSSPNTQLLSASERLDVYGVPVLNDAERREWFTFTDQEIDALTRITAIEDAVYFAVSLVFFKIKHTLVDFGYRDITRERQHVMARYFPDRASPKSLPNRRHAITRLEKTVLVLCDHQRFTHESSEPIQQALLRSASHYPKQRQLCKALLDLCAKHHVAIPAYSALQSLVTETWYQESQRIARTYHRHTTKAQRTQVLSLLDKTDNFHHFISAKYEMKGFTTEELNKETEKHQQLEPLFIVASLVIPKLQLPTTTIQYYASLINYYNGPRLKQVNQDAAQLYLLCYCFTRFQRVNDNLLEALKKRTQDFQAKGNNYAKDEALRQLEAIKATREKVSQLLIAIKQHADPKHVPRKVIYRYIPEDELLTAARQLADTHLDKTQLFWHFIDGAKASIALNLRPLFLTIDFVVMHDDLLGEVVSYMKSSLANKTFYSTPVPPPLEDWISRHDREYVMDDGIVIHNRFEFLFYKRLAYYINTHKLSLQHSFKYKRPEDGLMPPRQWQKKKRKILNTLGYDGLNVPIQRLLRNKQQELTQAYQQVNQGIVNGDNTGIKLVTDKVGHQTWRLRPLEFASDPNDSLFAHFQQCSIVDVIQFVSHKTRFTRAFEPILPRSTKTRHDDTVILAAVLANAIRLGSPKMASISDLDASALLTAEATFIRTETLKAAVDIVNNAAAKIPIYKQWYIDAVMHASLDGLKLNSSLRNSKARHSPKYFAQGIGVSGYNEIFNGFSLASKIIGANEYEGHFLFEMVHHQNTSDIKPSHFSTDKHGCNALNFGLFDLTDLIFAPRIPKPHRETFWGFGSPRDYDGYMIKPTKYADEPLIFNEWDNIQCMVASLLTGEDSPSNIISQLASGHYQSTTKKAFVQYNHLVRSQFLLKYLHDAEFRRAILIALNRGEAFNNLYRSITVLRKGELRGQSDVEMEVWNQCTRLISSIILYYNTVILNKLYENARNDEERAYLVGLSPGAWIHIPMLGFYQFRVKSDDDFLDQWIRNWDWRSAC
jgi:TnpA family transposase